LRLSNGFEFLNLANRRLGFMSFREAFSKSFTASGSPAQIRYVSMIHMPSIISFDGKAQTGYL